MKLLRLSLAILVLLLAKASYGLAPNDSTNPGYGADWVNDVHVAARACSAVFTPPASTTDPMGRVRVYHNFDAGVFGSRINNCAFDGTNLYIYCPGEVTVTVAPRTASSLFNLRTVTAYKTRVGDDYEIYGYYCSSTGCYGTRDGGGLDGTASPNSFQVSVTAVCENR